jgi:hypothetical protein
LRSLAHELVAARGSSGLSIAVTASGSVVDERLGVFDLVVASAKHLAEVHARVPDQMSFWDV